MAEIYFLNTCQANRDIFGEPKKDIIVNHEENSNIKHVSNHTRYTKGYTHLTKRSEWNSMFVICFLEAKNAEIIFKKANGKKCDFYDD